MALVEVLKNGRITFEEPSPRTRGADSADALHIERYNGNAAKVHGRMRLLPEDDFSLHREIKRVGDLGADRFDFPREPRSAAMRARLGLPALDEAVA